MHRLIPWGLVLRLGPYVCIALALAWGGVQTLRLSWLQTEVAEAAVEAEKAVNAARDADAKRTAELQATHERERAALQEKLNAGSVRIARAPTTATCVATPAAAAFTDGLIEAPQAGSGSPPATTARPDNVPRAAR